MKFLKFYFYILLSYCNFINCLNYSNFIDYLYVKNLSGFIINQSNNIFMNLSSKVLKSFSFTVGSVISYYGIKAVWGEKLDNYFKNKKIEKHQFNKIINAIYIKNKKLEIKKKIFLKESPKILNSLDKIIFLNTILK